MSPNSLIRKIKTISTFMTSVLGKQAAAIHILPSISRIKGNLTVKLGLLIEFDMRNISLKNHTENVMEKVFPDPILKNQN